MLLTGCPYVAPLYLQCAVAAFARWLAADSPPRVGQQHHHIPVEPLGYSQASPEKSFPAFKRYYEPTKTTYNFSIPTFLPRA